MLRCLKKIIERCPGRYASTLNTNSHTNIGKKQHPSKLPELEGDLPVCEILIQRGNQFNYLLDKEEFFTCPPFHFQI